MALLRRVVMRLVLKLRSAGSRPRTHAEVGGARMGCGWIIGLVSFSSFGLQASSTPCGTAEGLHLMMHSLSRARLHVDKNVKKLARCVQMQASLPAQSIKCSAVPQGVEDACRPNDEKETSPMIQPHPMRAPPTSA